MRLLKQLIMSFQRKMIQDFNIELSIYLIFIAFIFSLIINFLLIKSKSIHHSISSDDNFDLPQKFHEISIPRIGGLSIFLSLILCFYFGSMQSDYFLTFLYLLIYLIPCFFIGFLEDLFKNIGIKSRLIFTTFSSVLTVYFFNLYITDVDIFIINTLLSVNSISFLFTIFAITGLANAYNIIDGFNGLASMVAMICLLAIVFIAFKVNDHVLAYACLIVLGSISGFFVWNYPRGLIFLGDGGAYLIGFLIAVLSILLVKRNPTVSPWFALLVNGYPIFETLFTVWRRRIYQGENPGLPDGAHLHSLIYRRLIRWAEVYRIKNSAWQEKNARTSPYLWLISCFAVFPSIIWWDSTWVLQCFAFLFCIFYIWIYKSVVKFKTPNIFKWLR